MKTDPDHKQAEWPQSWHEAGLTQEYVLHRRTWHTGEPDTQENLLHWRKCYTGERATQDNLLHWRTCNKGKPAALENLLHWRNCYKGEPATQENLARPSSQQQGNNLYIKNLDNTIDDESLRIVFIQFRECKGHLQLILFQTICIHFPLLSEKLPLCSLFLMVLPPTVDDREWMRDLALWALNPPRIP